jgi:CRP/FNR family cyclic AMP-dependent transcriptional regulator
MTTPSLIAALRASRLAAELTDDQVRTLAGEIAFRDLQPGEVLVPEGTSDNHLYVIVSGSLGIVRNAGRADAATLFTITTGDLVGELSFLDETKHYASVVAVAPTRVFGLERERLEALLPQHPEIVYRVMRAIVRTVHEIQRRISMQSAELVNYIYKQHGRY